MAIFAGYTNDKSVAGFEPAGQQLLVGDGEQWHECVEREPQQWQHEQQYQGYC
jgi:hypothetical protein